MEGPTAPAARPRPPLHPGATNATLEGGLPMLRKLTIGLFVLLLSACTTPRFMPGDWAQATPQTPAPARS